MLNKSPAWARPMAVTMLKARAAAASLATVVYAGLHDRVGELAAQNTLRDLGVDPATVTV